MAWSKKIILSLLIGLLLASCSSKRNYGASYYSAEQSFVDTNYIDEFSMRSLSLETDSIHKYLEFDGIDQSLIESLNLDLNPSLIDANIVEVDSLFNEGVSHTHPTFNDSLNALAHNLDLSITDSIKKIDTNTFELITEDFLIDTNTQQSDTITSNSMQTVDTAMVLQDSISSTISIDSLRTSSGVNKDIDTTLTFELDDDNLDLENQNIIPVNIDVIEGSVLNTPANDEIETEMMDSLDHTIEVETTISDSIRASDQSEQNNKTEIADSLNQNTFETRDSVATIKDTVYITVDKATDSNQELTPSNEVIIENTKVITDTVIIFQENPQYSNEIDSLKSLNEALRLKAKQSNSMIDTLVYSIFFSSGGQLLNNRNQETLTELVNDSENKDYILQLSGHTDKSGSEQQNKILSEKRVSSVLNYVVKNGFDERKIFVQSFGEKFSTNNNDLNQRVVLCRLIVIR